MRNFSSKVYQPNYLSLVNNADKSHYGNWNTEKISEEKQVVQRKQIDKILHGVIKQRLFGNILVKDNQLSLQGYGDIQKQTIENFQRWSRTNGAKFSRGSERSTKKSRISPMYKTTFKISSKNSSMQKAIQNDIRYYTMLKRKSTQAPQNRILSFDKKITQIQKQTLMQININNNPNIQNYFRKIYNIAPNALIYQSKITKQQIKHLFKQKNIVSQEIIERFLNFFEVPSVLHFKQYISNLQEIMNNTTLREINFFAFQLFDKNSDGFITVQDLFKFVQENKNGSYIIEYDVFKCSKFLKIKQQNGNLQVRTEELTTQEILVRNHNIRIQQYRQLVKSEIKQIVNVNIRKSTIYHKSFQALEHNETIRLKNYQLESNKSSMDQDRSKMKKTIKQNKADQQKNERFGINLNEFLKIFHLDRPVIFYLIIQILTGHKFQHIRK